MSFFDKKDEYIEDVETPEVIESPELVDKSVEQPIESGNSFFAAEDAYIEPQELPEVEPEEMGRLEATGLGIAEGATLGGDRIVGGASAVAGEAVGRVLNSESRESAERTFEKTKQNIVTRRKQMLDKAIVDGDDKKVAELAEKIAQTKDISPSDIVDEYEPLKTYIEGKKSISDRQKQAWDEHPLYHLGGSFVGSSGLFGAAGKAATGLSKLGKVGKIAAKALPTTTGIEKATRIGSRAKKIKHLTELTDRYNKLQKLKNIKTASEAFKLGAKAGGITGFMTGEGELVKGEISQIAKDTVSGAAIGGTLGYGITKSGQMGSEVIKRIPILNEAIESFAMGVQGKMLDLNHAKRTAAKAARKWVNNFGTRIEKLGIGKKRLYKIADKMGTSINVTDDLAKLRADIDSLNPQERKAHSEFIDILESYYKGTSPELLKAKRSLEKSIAKKAAQAPADKASISLQKQGMKKAIEQKRVPLSAMEGQVGADDLNIPGVKAGTKSQVRAEMVEKTGPKGQKVVQEQLTSKDITPFQPSEITKSVDPRTGLEMVSYTDEATGAVVSKIGDKPAKIDASKLKLKDAERLIDQLNLYTGQTAEKQLPKGMKGIVRKTAQDVRNNINKELEKNFGSKAKDYNRKLNTLIEGTDNYIGLPSKGKGSAKQWKDEAEVVMSEFLAGTKDAKILTKKDQLIQRLHDDVSPQLSREFADDLTKIKKLYDLSKAGELTETQSASLSSLWGKAAARINQASNMIGRLVVSPVSKTSQLAKIGKNVLRMKAPQIDNLINQMMGLNNANYNKMFYRPLQKAMNSSEKSKNAVLFGLMQRPEFQAMIKEVQDKAGNNQEEEE